MHTITIENSRVLATSPEGQKAVLEIERLAELLRPAPLDGVFPDGLKWELRRGPVILWVHQTPPRVHSLKWIAPDSPVPYGQGTTYREVRIALPYIIVIAVYVEDGKGRPQLTGTNECFFRNEPLDSLDDALCYPALLNCSKFAPSQDQAPLAWICTQHVDLKQLQTTRETGVRMRRGLQALLGCLFECGFNYSSEHHEVTSWFSESRGVDPRVSSVEHWEAATRESPMFVLDVPWLPVGSTLRQVAARIAARVSSDRPAVTSAEDIARLVFNHGDTVT